MTGSKPDNGEFGALATFYEHDMVPMVFEPMAAAFVEDLSSRHFGEVLETAAGTGIVTRKLAALGPQPRSSIVATDVSQPMVDLGRSLTPSEVFWHQADATQLPFEDSSFDTVICQFGVMFFADKVQAYREARRVLRPDGQFIFSVWDRIQENAFVDTISTAVASLFPNDPPSFLPRVPHGYFDPTQIVDDLAAAGFRAPPAFKKITRSGRAPSAADVARAFTHGTPLRAEIESRAAGKLDEITIVAACALAAHFGAGPIEGQLQAYFVTVDCPN